MEAYKHCEQLNNPKKKEDSMTTRNLMIVSVASAAQVDINTTYDLLPTDWQAENRANAEVAINAVFDANQSGIPLDDNFVEHTAETVHAEWLQRKKASNEYVSEAQGKPYSELSAEDQERDRLVVRRAIEAFETIEAEEPAAT